MGLMAREGLYILYVSYPILKYSVSSQADHHGAGALVD